MPQATSVSQSLRASKSSVRRLSPGRDVPRTDCVMRPWIVNLAAVLVLCLAGGTAHARMGLIVGEPFGSFGTMMPQGHASIYLADLCVETAVHLRPCRPGELGAVISRYHDLRHPALDWLAFPLPVFLYGTEDLARVPQFMTAKVESGVRERYRE